MNDDDDDDDDDDVVQLINIFHNIYQTFDNSMFACIVFCVKSIFGTRVFCLR